MKVNVVIDTLVLEDADGVRPARLRAELERQLGEAFSGSALSRQGQRARVAEHLTTRSALTERGISAAVSNAVTGLVR